LSLKAPSQERSLLALTHISSTPGLYFRKPFPPKYPHISWKFPLEIGNFHQNPHRYHDRNDIDCCDTDCDCSDTLGPLWHTAGRYIRYRPQTPSAPVRVPRPVPSGAPPVAARAARQNMRRNLRTYAKHAPESRSEFQTNPKEGYISKDISGKRFCSEGLYFRKNFRKSVSGPRHEEPFESAGTRVLSFVRVRLVWHAKYGNLA